MPVIIKNKLRLLNAVFSTAGIFLFTTAFSQSYTEPSKLQKYVITINFEDHTVKAEVLSHPKDINVDLEKTYMWYSSQKIMETRGGYEGKLMHGKFTSFYLNNQLKEKGSFCYGLKQGEWRYWYSDGKLREVINWKKGVKKGYYALYNDQGQLMAKGRFRDNKLHGKFFTFGRNGKVLEKKRFKNGEELPSEIKQKSQIGNGQAEKSKPDKKEFKPNDEKKKKPGFLKRLFKGKDKAKSEPGKESENKTSSA